MGRCPPQEQLERFAAGECDDEASRSIEAHLGACNECRTWLASGSLDDARLVVELRHAARNVTEVEPARSPPVNALRSALPAAIGEYRIIRKIGEGGMGVVFEAEQQAPRRRVALKVIRGVRRLDAQSIRLFQREAEALARLRDPGIATIYAAGCSEDGEHYFSMELVDGLPLDAFIRQRQPARDDRLRLFIRICAAVWYAHQRGVIHRDLKPSNILVTELGTEPSRRAATRGTESETGPSALNSSLRVRRRRMPACLRASPKILDFGLAQFTDADGSTVAETLEAGRLRGSLQYMSPEQSYGGDAGGDVRSDVYSLGVVLYEMLAGQPPLRLAGLGLPEALRAIRETHPQAPSAIERALRGDLETILLHALEKAPERRYASVAALMDDVERYLDGRPILARPPSSAYRLKKLMARHKLAFALASVAAIVLIGFAATISVLYANAQFNLHRAELAEQEARAEAERARVEAETSERVRAFLVRSFSLANPDVARGQTVTVHELLDRAVTQLPSLRDEPLVQARFMVSLGSVYQNLGLSSDARPLLEEALTLHRRLLGDSAADVAANAAELGNALYSLRDLPGAAAAYQIAADAVRAQCKSGDWHVPLALIKLAEVQSERGEHAAAETAMRDALELSRSAPHGEQFLPNFLNALGGTLEAQGRYADAVPYLREALERSEREDGVDHPTSAAMKSNLAWLLANTGALEEAETLATQAFEVRKRVLPAWHPARASTLFTLGTIQLQRNKPADAEPFLREAYDLRRAVLKAHDPAIGEAAGMLAECLLRQDRLDDAQPLALAAFEQFDRDKAAQARSRRESIERLIRIAQKQADTNSADRWRAMLAGEAQ